MARQEVPADLPAIAISPWTLRFRAKGQEAGFVSWKRDDLERLIPFVYMGLIAQNLVMFITMAMLYQSPDFDPELFAPFAIASGVLAFWSFCGIFLVFLFRCTSFARRIDPRTTEIMQVGVATLLVLSATMCKEYFLGRLFGILDSYAKILGSSCFSDSFILMVNVIVQAIFHQTLPIRYCNLWPLEIFGPMSYAVSSAWVGSPEQYPTLLFIIYCIFVTILAAGKRHNEKTERLMFRLLTQERVRRTEVEFELDRVTSAAAVTDDHTNSDAMSAKSTNLSSLIFNGKVTMTDVQQARFELMIDLARQERWYIPIEDLQVGAGIGKGAFGSVARGKLLHAEVAIKTPLELSREKEFELLCNELRMLRRIRHPNVVSFYGAAIMASNPPTLLLVEEYVRGDSLRDAWPGCTQASLARILLGVSSALVHLHEQELPIVHGDLKPANIMIGYGGEPKIIDFGLARLEGQQEKMGGTLMWMAPEVIIGCGASIAADIFSLGRLLFFVSTGELPIKKSDFSAVEKLAREGRVPELQWPADLSALQGHCKRLSEGCFQFLPDARMTSRSVLNDLSTSFENLSSSNSHGGGRLAL